MRQRSLLRAPNGYEPVPRESQRSPRIPSRPNSDSTQQSVLKKGKFYIGADMQTPWVCGVGYEVRSICSVNCVEENFFADLSIFVKWYDDAHIHFSKGEIESNKLKNKPHLILANSVNVKARYQTYSRVTTDPPGVISSETVYTGTFREFMELEDFPLDSQDLTVSVRFADERWSVRLLNDPKCSMITDGVELSEWLMYAPHVKLGRIAGGAVTFELKMKVFRKYDYYMLNVIVMMGGITSLVFFSFLFEPSMWEQKSTYCATLLLTSVAFKFVVDGSLPKVAFTTILDIYMLVAFTVMVGVLVQGAFMKALERFGSMSGQQLENIDVTFGVILCACWMIWNVLYIARFKQFEMQQKQSLGELLPHIITNKASPGSCRSFLCCHRAESDDEKNSEEDSDEEKEWPDVEESKSLLSCCTALEIDNPETIVRAQNDAGAAAISTAGAPPLFRDQQKPRGSSVSAVGTSQKPSGPSRYPADATPLISAITLPAKRSDQLDPLSQF